MRRHPRTLLLAALLVAVIGPTPSAFAEYVEPLTLSPVIVEKTLRAGQVYEDAVRVTSTTTQAVMYEVTADDFTYSPAGQLQFTSENDPPSSTATIKSWITVSERRMTLNPGETRLLVYTITVPPDAKPGGHYGVLFFTTNSAVDSESRVPISSRIGTMILVEVPGAVTKTAVLERLDVGTPAANSTSSPQLTTQMVLHPGPALFRLELRGTGNTHFIPQGGITIRDIVGRTVLTIPVQSSDPSDQRRIFPGALREINRLWDATSLSPGLYSATAALTDGTGKPLPQQRLGFIIPPPSYLLQIIASLLG